LKVISVRAMKASGNKVIASLTSLPGRWTVNLTLRPLYSLRKVMMYSLNRTLSGFQCRSGRFGEEENIIPLMGIEPW